MSELSVFHNRLRILRSIDFSELINYGVVSSEDTQSWQSFRKDPYTYFIRASDETVERLWKIIEARESNQKGGYLGYHGDWKRSSSD